MDFIEATTIITKTAIEQGKLKFDRITYDERDKISTANQYNASEIANFYSTIYKGIRNGIKD